MNERDNRNAVAEQFANDWLLVAMNDYDTYTDLMYVAGGVENTVALSEQLREGWENLTAQVVELVEENISPVAGLFIAQMLQGQGTLPFDLIAREVLATRKEQEAMANV
jgi:hypothetical protein